MAHRIILAIVTVAALLHTLPATAATETHSHKVRTATAESCTVADGPKGTTLIHCKHISVTR